MDMKLYIFENGMYKPSKTPFPGFLIVRGNDKILIDTGITQEDSDKINRDNGDDGMVVTDDHLPINCLKKIGIAPEMVTHVINTHFHFDHCGFNESFPNARFFVQRDHYGDAMHSRDEGYGLTKRHWENNAYEFVDGDEEILPGIHAVRTDGHVTGIQSIVVELNKRGNVLIASDAMRDSRMLHDENPARYSMFDDHPEKVREGVKKLRETIRERSISLVIYNHDGTLWPTYKKSPEYYD